MWLLILLKSIILRKIFLVFTFFSDLSYSEALNKINDIMTMPSVQTGLDALGKNMPGFDAFYETMISSVPQETSEKKSFWDRTREDCPVMSRIL